jgi:hypothetical protein
MSVSFDDLFDESVKPTVKAAPKNAAISFDDLFEQAEVPVSRERLEPMADVKAKTRQIAIEAIGRPSDIDYMTPDNIGGVPEFLRKRQPWEQPITSRYPAKTRSGGRGTNMPALGSINNPYPTKDYAIAPDGAYVKTREGVNQRKEIGIIESGKNLAGRFISNLVEGTKNTLPALDAAGAANRLKEVELYGGYYIGDTFIPANEEEVAGLRAIQADALGSIAVNKVSGEATRERYQKSADRAGFDQELAADKGFLPTLGTLVKNPLDSTALITESLAGSSPAIAVSALTRNPYALAAIGGASNYQQEMASGIANYLDEKQIPREEWASLPKEVIAEAVEQAQTRALVVGAGGVITGGVASKALVPSRIASTPAKAAILNPLAQGGVGATGDYATEALAQVASGQGYNPQEALLEAVAGAPAQAIASAQATIEAARLRGQSSDAPAQQSTPEVTPEDLGAIGQAIEAKADAEVQQKAEAQRSFTEAGSVIDNRIAELESATKPRLDKAEAKALQAELQDINDVLREQEQLERNNVIRSPENNISAADKARLGERQAEIKSRLEAHRAAGSAESQLRELQSKLGKIDNDNDLLAFANSLAPPTVKQSFTVQNSPVQDLGELGNDPIGQIVQGIQDNPEVLNELDAIITELGGIAPKQQPPEPTDDLDALISSQVKTGSQAAEPAPLSASQAPESQTNLGEIEYAKSNTGIEAVGAAQQTKKSQRLASAIQNPASRVEGGQNASFLEVPRSALPERTNTVLGGLSNLFGVDIVVVRDVSKGFKLDADGVRLGGTLYLMEDMNNPAIVVAGHELGHEVQFKHKDLYKRLTDFVAVNGDVLGYRNKTNKGADKSFAVLSADEALVELTNDAIGDAMGDIDFWKRLANLDPTLFQDLAKVALDFIDSLTGRAKNLGSDKFLKDVQGFRKELEAVLQEVAKRQSGSGTISTPTNKGESNENSGIEASRKQGRADSQVSGQAAAREVQQSRRVGRSDGQVELDRGQEYRKSAEGEQPTTLAGLPRQIIVDGRTVEFGGFKTAQDAAKRYMEQAGFKYDPPTSYAQIDTERAQAIADEFSAMAHNPSDPQTKRAYEAMIQETLAQYQAILDTGLQIEFITGEDPYGNPRNAIIDIVDNNHFWVFPTNDGFGSGTLDVSDNPMLVETEYTISGKPALANDIFRVVHDYFGHAKEGVGFRATGEENAWRSHSAMYSPLARRAMTTETRGQNSWVNYGEFGEQNRKASPADTIYAEQKVGLLPEWVSEDGAQFSRKKGTMRNEKETSNTDEQSGVRQANARPSAGSSGARVSAPTSPTWLKLPEIAQDVPTFGNPRQNSVAVVGVHYSSVQGLSELDSRYAGSGSAGAERRRFGIGNYGATAKAGDTARRLYFYAKSNEDVPSKEQAVSGNSRYMVRMDNLYDTESDPLGLVEQFRRNPDAFEEAVVEAGFDGALYDYRGIGGITEPVVVLFGLKKKVPVVSFSRKQNVTDSRDWTFSPLARMVEGAPLKQVSADQWKKWIAANSTKMGVKADELEYTGINEWLDLQQGKLSKEDVSAYLDAGGVRVEEVLKREEADIDEGAIANYIETYVQDESSGIENGSVYRYENGVIDVMEGDEILYSGDPSMVAEELNLDPDDIGADTEVTKFGEYRPAGGTKYRELLLTLPDRDSAGRFSSSHWDEENILAHIRFDDRKDADGNDVLFINEIQSDWGQKGRKDGFASDDKAERVEVRKTENGYGVFADDRIIAETIDSRRADEIADERFRKNRRAKETPKAPFVTDTKAWVALAIKRMIRYAVDNNIDRIAFINGEQAADLYDLSKRIKEVTYWKNKDGTYGVYAYGLDGGRILSKQRAKESELEDIIGKELAKKIIETAPSKGDKTLSGLDLKVGGEGMKAFYDKLVPQVANDVLKKLGGGKVEHIRVNTTETLGDVGSGSIAVVRPNGDVIALTDYDSQAHEIARQHAGSRVVSADEVDASKGSAQLGFTIPQALRDKVAAGEVPLFSRKYTGTAGWNYDTNTWEGVTGELKKAREALQDKMLAWRDVQAAIEKGIGSPLPDAQNVYRLENLMHGRVSDGMKELERKYWMPIDRDMNRLGVKPEQLQEYLVARHAPERNARIASINPQMPDGGSGMTTADANAYIAGLSPDELTKLKTIAAKVDALIKDTLTRQFNSGLIDSASYSVLTSMYKHYVPLRGTEDEYESEGSGTGQGLDGRGKLIKNALGRGAGNEAKNVLGEVIGDSQRSLVAAEKARVGRALMRLVLANPSTLWEVEPVQTMRYLDANGDVAEKVVQDWSDPSIIAVKHNGKLYKVEIKDPRLMAGLKNLGVAHLNGFLTATAKVNRYFSAVLTQYNPAFIPVNASRDMIFGLTGMAVEHGTKLAAKTASNYPFAAAAAYRYARGKSGNSQYDTWAKEFSKAGGKTGYVHMESVEELQAKLGSGKLGSFDPQGVRKFAALLADGVSNINDAVENALRLSAYITLRENGMSVEKAAEYAKNLTVNFNRKGTNGTQINALLLFFNASVQGAARSLKVMKNHKTYAYLGTMAALQTIAAMYAMGLKEDDDEDSLWDKIPDHVKRRNIVIPVDASHYMTIPMPYGMNVFTYSASKMVDAITNKGERPEQGFVTAVADIMNAAVESFSPVPLDEGVWGLVPQAIRPAVNIARNKDGLGIPIRKENPYDRADAPLASVGKPDTMEIFKVTATGLNRLGGGDDYKAPPFSMFDRAPEDIEYILKELGGGAGKFVLDVATLGEKAYASADLTMRDIPIAKRFFTSVDDVASQQALYYDRTQSIVRAENELKDIFKQDGKSAAEYFIERTPELTGARIVGVTSTGNPKLKARGDTVYALYKQTEKAIDARNDSYRSAYKEAGASILPNEKTIARDREIKELNRERAEQQKSFNKAWHRDVVSISE